MTNEDVIKILEAYRDKLTNSVSNQLDGDIEAFSMAIKALETIPKYKDAYNKGWDDGAKATYEHLKMCEEEQEPCEDCISRKSIKQKLQEHHDFFVNAYGGFSNLPQNDKSRVDEISNCIAMVVNEPPVNPQPCEDAISRDELLKAIGTWDKFGCDADTKLVPYQDHYIPYIHYDDVIRCIKGMPTVNTQEPKTDVLDKIRAEIEELADADGYGDYQLGFSFGLMMAMEIIDKYRAERSDKE